MKKKTKRKRFKASPGIAPTAVRTTWTNTYRTVTLHYKDGRLLQAKDLKPNAEVTYNVTTGEVVKVK